MDRQKINDYIDAYSKAIQLPDNYTKILKELMPKIIEKYSKTISSVSVEQDDYTRYVIKPVNGEYSVEDFFLNRLMRNVWAVDGNSIAKGDFSPTDMRISIDETKLESQLNGRIDESRDDFNEIAEIAKKKVIMHEFEHALQTQYRGESLDFRYRGAYRRIIEEVKKINNGKYARQTNSYDDINKPEYGYFEDYIHIGLHYGSQQNQKIKTYREIEGEGNLNEIFNETEALEMAEARPQMRHKYPNGVYYVIKNRESSNYPITNYGNILKTLLGDELTFTGMYLNPEELFKTFNMKYNDVFQSAYNSDKDAWQILIEQLQSIKKSKNDDETNYDLNQKLQEALVRCLEKDIDIELQKSDTDLGLLNRKIIQFRREALNGDDKSVRSEIKHFTILKSLKQRIELAYEEQQTGIEVEQESRDKSDNDEQTKTKSVERWTERPVIKKVNGYRNVADKWSTPSTINGEKHSAVDKWARPVETPKRKIDAADKWKIQSHLRDGKDSSSDTSKSGPGLTQEMGQTPYQIEAEKRKQELCFSAVKRAITQAKITEQEVNNETLQIKEREELEILKKKGFAKTTEERARYTYLKSKYEPQVQRQQKRQSKGQSR